MKLTESVHFIIMFFTNNNHVGFNKLFIPRGRNFFLHVGVESAVGDNCTASALSSIGGMTLTTKRTRGGSCI
jgi:hypothetical protein